MMEAEFWTQTTTPQEWLLKVKSGKTWQTLKANLENDFAENPETARKEYGEYPKEYISNDDVRKYWKIHRNVEDVLSIIWEDIDLTESKLRLNVVGMLAEEWLEAYNAQKAVEDKPSLLNTDEANRLWDIAKEHKWVDENRMPMLSVYKATVLAKVMAKVLNLAPQWQPFEELWGMNNLSVKYSRASFSKYHDDLYDEIERAFS